MVVRMEPVLVLTPGRAPARYYPARHYELVRRAQRGLGIVVVGGGIPTAALAAHAVAGSGSVLVASLTTALFLFTLLAGIGGLWDACRHIRIIPFFASPVGETDTFLYGQALAREFERLETLAEYAGAAPISSFGFPDPLAGETVSWHPAGEGLRSAQALLAAVDSHGYLFDEPEAVRADLRRWETAMGRAAEQEIGFSLLLLHGNTTSSLEWERRGGSPF